MASPGPRKPADRIPALSALPEVRGYDLPMGVGEYNGFTAETITAAGEALLGTPNVWFGCMWNANGDARLGAHGRPAGGLPADPRRPAERRTRLTRPPRFPARLVCGRLVHVAGPSGTPSPAGAADDAAG